MSRTAVLSDSTRFYARLRETHEKLLLPQSFYPLTLATLLGFAFFIARIALAQRLEYCFLVWNLFLAWIPYWLSLLALHLDEAHGLKRGRVTIALIWLAWLVMFPNAPYILTDFIHLRRVPPLTWWYDLGLVATFAITGCFLAVASLRIMHDIVRPRVGILGGWLFVLTVAALTGFGIYLGRFLRFNSWDLLTHPHVVLWEVLRRIINPLGHPRTIGVTLMFGGMTLVMYLMFVSMTQPRRHLNGRAA